MQQLGILLIVEKDAEMLVGSARRSSSGAAEHQENRALPAERVVHARAHPAVMEALRVGRLVAWRKLAAGVSEHLSSETCCGDLSARGLCNRSLRSSSKPACRSSLTSAPGPGRHQSTRCVLRLTPAQPFFLAMPNVPTTMSRVRPCSGLCENGRS